MSTWDKELAPAVQKLDDKDKAHFIAFITRMKLGEVLGGTKGGIPFGTTVGQAIEEQKKWAAEAETRQAASKNRRAAAAARAHAESPGS